MNKLISALLCIILVFSTQAPAIAAVKPTSNGFLPAKNIEKLTAVKNLEDFTDGKMKLKEVDGQLFLSGKLSSRQIAGENAAKKFIEKNKAIFGIDNVTEELVLAMQSKEKSGGTVVKYTQNIDGTEVEGSSLIVRFDDSGTITGAIGKIETDKILTKLGNTEISEDAAIRAAEEKTGLKNSMKALKPVKVIINKNGKNYAAYKVNISDGIPAVHNFDVYVEVYSGIALRSENRARHDGPVLGTGVDVQGQQRNLNLYLSGASYQMIDVTKSPIPAITTYTLNQGTSLGYVVSGASSFFNAEDYKASVSAHYHTGAVLDFYRKMFDRNSLDNAGMPVKSFTHYGTGYNNAFWDGNEIIYGDGDGSRFTYMSGDLDIVAHEMTHGVINYGPDLYYHNQSGALNESLADTFGVLVSTYVKYNVASGGTWLFDPKDWVIGDDIYTPNIAGDALRSLANPALYGQPADMSHYVQLSDDEHGDYGGVHLNSGIPNKAAYLVASSIGMEKTARIYYKAMNDYVGAYTDFEGFENCLEFAAADLYGLESPEAAAINNAFREIGIIQMPLADPFEPNDTKESAHEIEFGQIYESYISSENDIDYYKMVVPNDGKLILNLTNLPADYDLTLFDADMNLKDTSWNTNLAPEYIDCDISAGTYYVLVNGYNCSDTANKYKLSAEFTSVPITGIFLDKEYASVPIGGTVKLSTRIEPVNATNTRIVWRSDNVAVATIDENGLVTGVGNGIATITATTLNGANTAKCTIAVGSYTVTFNSNGGSAVASKSASCGTLITAPAAPTKTGHTFKGWFKDAALTSAWNFTTDKITSATTLYAKWMPNSYTVTFNSNGGSAIASKSASFNTLVTAPAVPTKAGYTFTGWYKDAALISPWNFASDKIAANTTIYAKWVQNPAAVASPKAVPTGYNSATTSWQAVSGATGYELYRSTSSAGTYSLVTATTATSYSNTSLAAGTTYYYKARAYKTVGSYKVYGAYSAVVSAKPVPAVPGSFKSASAGYNSTTTSWQAVSGASGYELYRSTSSAGTYSLVTATTATSYSNTSLATGTTYYYKARAYRLVGTTKVYGNYTAAASSKPVPAVPGSFKSASAGYNSTTTSWQAVSGASGYELYRSTSATGTYSLVIRTTATSYKNSYLETGKTYYYKARAYRLAGTTKVYGNYTAVASSKPVPAIPGSFTAVRASSTSIKITWSAVSGASGYEVHRSTSSAGPYSLVKSTTSRYYTNTSLKTGTAYYYKVRAYKVVGTAKVYSGWTAIKTARP